MKRARQKGKSYGIKKGKQEMQLEIAKKLLNKGVPIEAIKEITGLDEETIKKVE